MDGLVVLFGLLVIGMGIGQNSQAEHGSWLLSFYSLIAIFVSSRMLAFVLNGTKDDKMVLIITDKPLNDLRLYIIEELERTATCVDSRGLYSDASKQMLLMVVKNKEVLHLKHAIKEIDPQAFVVVTDAYDTYGEGWQVLPSKGDINPE